MTRAVYIDFNPDDPGENWKRTVGGALDRLRECEAGMEREHGTTMNLGWMYWNSEWGVAWEWLEKRAPKVARRLAAEANAKLGTNAVDEPAPSSGGGEG